MDCTTSFMEKQKKIIKKREKGESLKKERQQKEEDRKKKEIEDFFEENKEIIITNTINSFMEELNNGSLPPYKVDYKLNTSFFFGAVAGNIYEVFFENMIKDELRKNIGTIGSIEVDATILTKEDGYYFGPTWIQTGTHPEMSISISLNF